MKELYRFRQFLTEGDFKNPILDKYLEIKKSIDNKTVFDYELSDFINDLDNTERKGLESDLGLERDELYEGVIKEDSEDIAEMAYERDSVEDIVKRIKPILSNHPQLKKQEDPEQYLIDFVTKRKRFINKNEAPIGKDKFARNIGTMPYDKYIKLQFNEYIYSTTP